MATKVIHATAYKLTADTKGFNKELLASRRELQDAKRVMREVQTPLEKYEQKTKKIETLVRKGAISQEQANLALAKYQKELTGATAKQNKLFAALAKHKGLIAGVFSVGTVMKFASGVNDAFTRMDELAKQGRTLGTGAGSLLRIQEAAALTGGMDAGATNTALEKMLKTVGDAVQGRGTGKSRLEQLKLDAQELQQMSADQQFLAIADAIRQVSNENEQVNIVQDIFGRSQARMVEVLRQGSKEILAQTKHLEERASFLDSNATKAEAVNDAFTRMSSAWQGMMESVAIGVTGSMTDLAVRLEQIAKDGTLAKLAVAFVDFVTISGGLISTLQPLVSFVASGYKHAFSSTLESLEADPQIADITSSSGPAGAFFGVLGRQITKMGIGPQDLTTEKAGLTAEKMGVDTAALRAHSAGLMERMRNDPRMKALEAERAKQQMDAFKKQASSQVSAFAPFGEGIAKAFFKSVVDKEAELTQQQQSDAFTGMSIDTTAFDVKQQNAEQELAQAEQLRQQLAQQPAKSIGSLAGRDSIEAFATQFGVGGEDRVVDKLDDIETEIMRLKNELIRIAGERAKAEQQALARGLSKF